MPALMRIIMSAVPAAGCGSSDEPGEPSPGSAATSSSVEASSVTSPSAEGAQLEGTWRTGSVSEAEIEATLNEEGLGTWVDRLRGLPANAAPVGSNVFVLDVGDGRWDLSWEPNGAAAEPLDYDATYEVDGDTVTVTHEGRFNRYRWSVKRTTLKLTWVDTNYPAHKGIPEEVYQTAFYMSDSFEQQE